MDSSDEMLAYLHGQIDPRDRANPKYALLWKQIEAVNKAKADILAAQPITMIVRADAITFDTAAEPKRGS
jgi:hypothetical protein